MMQQRDLLLVPFPFSDQSGRKVRPVIVVSNTAFNEQFQDLIVVGVTSNISLSASTIRLTNHQLEEGKLLSTCCIKVENILKIDKKLVLKKIGKINTQVLEIIISTLFGIIKPDSVH